MAKLVAFSFLVLGIGYFLLATKLLSLTSETALVHGSLGLVPGVLGFIGGMFGRRSVARAIAYGVIFAALGGGLLMVFLRVIWPLL